MVYFTDNLFCLTRIDGVSGKKVKRIPNSDVIVMTNLGEASKSK